MRLHVLKCHQMPFEAVWSNRKVHECRLNDRSFSVNDRLVLRETCLVKEGDSEYTGRVIVAQVTYITFGRAYSKLPDEPTHDSIFEGYCVMSIRVLARGSIDPDGSWAVEIAEA